MNKIRRLGVGLAAIVLMLRVGLSWGQLPSGNDISDPKGNTGSGSGTLAGNTGSQNTASGAFALYGNTEGADNTASGYASLFSSTAGSLNTASGAYALYGNITGTGNTASGYASLFANTHGTFNTAIGFGTLPSNANGRSNIAIGTSAGMNLVNGGRNIYLGNEGAATESNTMRLGQNGHQTHTFIAGIAGTPLNGSTVVIDASGQLGILASSARYKREIHDMGERSQGVFQLRPVTFRYTQDPQGVLQYGLIAEEVAAIYPELVVHGVEGTVEAVHYHGLIPLLLNELQHQQQELAGQARQLTVQSEQLAELKAQNERLQAAVGRLQERDEAQRAQPAAWAATPASR